VSALVALFILPRAWSLLRSGLDVLLESTPSHLDLKKVVASVVAAIFHPGSVVRS
jgi:Co/Zn/Cd efflux system component